MEGGDSSPRPKGELGPNGIEMSLSLGTPPTPIKAATIKGKKGRRSGRRRNRTANGKESAQWWFAIQDLANTVKRARGGGVRRDRTKIKEKRVGSLETHKLSGPEIVLSTKETGVGSGGSLEI